MKLTMPPGILGDTNWTLCPSLKKQNTALTSLVQQTRFKTYGAYDMVLL